jgi:predicted deacylase
MALTLQKLSIDYDICLDLHCANRSVRHAYVPAYAKESASFLKIPFHLLMPDDKFGGAMDEVFFAPWTELVRRRGRGTVPVQGITVELGNHEQVCGKEARKDLDGILNYLRHMGVVSGKAEKFKPVCCDLENYQLISAPQGGIAEFLVQPGEAVKAGQVVVRILNFKDEPDFLEIKAPKNGYVILQHSSAVVNEGAELIKICSP